MRQLVLEKIVISGFPPVNKRCLWLKGNTFYFWYKGAWRSIDSEIDINNEYIDEKVSEVVSKEIETVIGSAPDNLDTLSEIADYLAKHEEEATEMQSNIGENKTAIEELDERLDNLNPESCGWTDVP